MCKNRMLSAAMSAKTNEHYTKFADIENELRQCCGTVLGRPVLKVEIRE